MIIWGVSWASSKVCTSYCDPVTLLFLKISLSAVAMLPFVAKRLFSMSINLKIAIIIFLASLFLIFYNIFFFLGLEVGFASFGGVFVTTINPVITFLLVAYITKTNIEISKKIALAIGVVGGLVMLKIWDFSAENILHSGNLYFLLAAFGWSVVSILSSEGSKIIDTITLTFLFLFFSSIFIFWFVPQETLANSLEFGFVFWFNAFIAFVLTTAFATTMYFKGVAILGPAKASSYLFLVPLFAIISSNIILDESIESTTIFGGILAIFALMMINKK